MNLNLYGHAGAWLMVDCGISFDDDAVIMPDITFIESWKDLLVGIIATHAHQDHIGALPELWPTLNVPIYTTPFTAEIIRRRFVRDGISDTSTVTVDCHERLNIGPFDISWLPITHSTPETQALLIRTPAATVLHTADWKVDPNPVIGRAFRPSMLPTENINAVVCDSTNATQPGHSVSEGDLVPGLRAIVENAPGKVIVTCFASNVARLKTLATLAAACGRYVGIIGRGMQEMWEAASACGYLDDRLKLVDVADLGYLPSSEVLLITSGSQGEPGSGLGRLAADSHPDLYLDEGDTVVFSARAIPGNEDNILKLVSQIENRGAVVIQADGSNQPIHASGHPHSDELLALYETVKPELVIPVHGEPEHMAANAALARQVGIPHQLTGQNGDLFIIAGAGDTPALDAGFAPAGRVRRN